MATVYTAPQRDMRFVLHELLNVERFAHGAARLRRGDRPTLVDAIIEEGVETLRRTSFCFR